MLVVIAKEVAGEEGTEMIFLQGSGFVFVARFMTVFVRDVGPEIEQLKCRQNTREGPE